MPLVLALSALLARRAASERRTCAVGGRGATCRPATLQANADVVEGLEPASLWEQFAAIASVPRPSRKEQAIVAYLKEFAEARNLTWKEDGAGNLVIFRPGSGGGEDAEPVMLQGHVDMVCEKNTETNHNFDTDPILLRAEEGWLRATGTTLGADNGIGVAAALAVLELDETATLPPIEALFTMDEETGLNGAFGLDGNMLSATRILNLDTEEFGSVYIGCAGGGVSTLKFQSVRSPVAEGLSSELHVRGLLGGHSGVNIHENRGNALVIANGIISSILAAIPEARLVAIDGGDKDNAIPREASATLWLPSSDAASVADALLAKKRGALKEQYGVLETHVDVTFAPWAPPAPSQMAFSRADSMRMVSALHLLPNGVLKMSHAVEGLVETSNNVASFHTSDSGLRVVMSTRSSYTEAIEAVREQMRSVAELSGADLEHEGTYPGWAPMPKSPLVDLTVRKLRPRFPTEPQILAIHAGLECGLLLEKCPTAREAVSFGPTITGAHSPDEALEIKTVQPFFEALLDILAELATHKDP